MKSIAENLRKIYEKVNVWSGGRLDLFRQVFSHFGSLRGAEAAAGMAYYALFSLFPLALLLISGLGLILESEAAYQQVLGLMLALFPFSGELINTSLSEVLEKRGAIGILGLIGLVWSATGFFDILGRSVNRAWPSAKLRGFVQSRLIALGMVGALFVLLLLSLISSTFIGALPALAHIFGFQDWVFELSIWNKILRLVPPLFTLLLFMALYRWVPNKDVRWRAVVIGALAVTVVWELGKAVFTAYLRSGFARYEVVYGSLSTLIALMVWVYFSSLITLLGAHIVAAIDIRAEQAAAQEAEAKPVSVFAEPGRLRQRGDHRQPSVESGNKARRNFPEPDTGEQEVEPPAERAPVKGVRG